MDYQRQTSWLPFIDFFAKLIASVTENNNLTLPLIYQYRPDGSCDADINKPNSYVSDYKTQRSNFPLDVRTRADGGNMNLQQGQSPLLISEYTTDLNETEITGSSNSISSLELHLYERPDILANSSRRSRRSSGDELALDGLPVPMLSVRNSHHSSFNQLNIPLPPPRTNQGSQYRTIQNRGGPRPHYALPPSEQELAALQAQQFAQANALSFQFTLPSKSKTRNQQEYLLIREYRDF